MVFTALLAVALGAVVLFAAPIARAYFFGCPPPLKRMPSVPLLRFLWSIIAREPVDVRLKMMSSATNEDGFAKFWFMNRWMVVVTNPRHIRYMFTHTDTFPKLDVAALRPNQLSAALFGKNIINANGNDWKRHRKAVAPAFHNFQTYVDVFAASSKQLSQIINKEIENKPDSAIDVCDLFQRLTLDVICNAGFNYPLDSLGGKNTRFLSAYRRFMKGVLDQLPVFFPFLEKYNISGRRTELLESVATLNEKLYEVIHVRRQQIDAWRKQLESPNPSQSAGEDVQPPNDLLALMIRACDADGMLTPDELRDDLLIFFIAGHETTASALGTALYYLSAYPAVQEKARAECDSIMAGKPKDATPTFTEQKQMNYLTSVIKECLRLNSPVGSLPLRYCAPAEGAQLGSQHIPQGTLLMASLYCAHHDPEIWGENVCEFDPGRFAEHADEGIELPEKAPDRQLGSQLAELERTAWMPFGGGTRVCTGKNFSLTEQRMVLAHLLRQFKMTLPANSKHRNGLINRGTGLLHPDGVEIKFARI